MLDEKEIYLKAIKTFGKNKQLVVAMEECSELIKELSKCIRDKGNIQNLAEEIADVEIMIGQLLLIFNCYGSYNAKKTEKLTRLAERLSIMPEKAYRGIDKIKNMTVSDWFNQALNDEHLTPDLCFMCVGCEECKENCAYGIEQYLEKPLKYDEVQA